MSFDPFGDFDTTSYLQNALQLKEPEEVKRAEHFTVFKGSQDSPVIWSSSGQTLSV